MVDEIPLYVIGLEKDESIKEVILSKFDTVLKKGTKMLPKIIEARISIKSQNIEGTRTHYDVTSSVTTSKNSLIYTESGWDILKICDKLCKNLESEFSKHDNKRQQVSIRKKEN